MGVDVLTGGLALAVQAINAAALVFDAASAAVSGVSLYQDIRSGASGGKTALDALGFATSVAGLGAGGMALRTAGAAARAESTFEGAVSGAIRSQTPNLIAGDISGMSNFLATTGERLAAAATAADKSAEWWATANVATGVAAALDTLSPL